MKLLIENGLLVHPGENRNERAAILIDEGLIAGILNAEEAAAVKRADMDRIIDATDMIVAPGLIDMHTHLREPGQEYKETIESGSRAAAAGGFTAVACMPNTTPPNDNSSVTQSILDKARSVASCRVYPVASITAESKGERLTEFGDLLRAGAIAFSDDGRPVGDSDVMRLALEYARAFDALIISHAEDRSLSGTGVMHEGFVSTRMGLSGIPRAAEDIAVFRDVALCELTGSRLHIAHVSTKGAVWIIREAKARGVKVTAETAPHYFTLTHEAVEGFNTHAKMNPPLREAEDVEAIKEGLKDGTIDAIATDHAPHSELEKNVEFDQAAFGIVGLETSLGLTMELARQNILTLEGVLQKLSSNPARILKVKGGSLEIGNPADITIIDPDLPYTVDAAKFESKGKNSPFDGRGLTGRAVMTICAGAITWKVEEAFRPQR